MHPLAEWLEVTNMDTENEKPPVSHRQIDGSKIQFWALKRDAVAAAKSIGWLAKDVGQVWTRFQVGYAIRDNDGQWMTKERFSFIRNIR